MQTPSGQNTPEKQWSHLTQVHSQTPFPSTTSVPGAAKLTKKAARKLRTMAVQDLAVLQEALYAQGSNGVLLVLQGLDTAGKDGTIRKVFDGVNPQGVKVHGFKVPTPYEASHDYLFRIHAAVPGRGEIGVFNRSHYEDLIVPLVNGELQGPSYERRVEEIHHFERYLRDQHILIIKLYLHVSWEEQGARLLSRLDRPEKHWKFSPNDIVTREHFSKYANAYERIIPDTSFEEAPWHIIPSDKKWYRNAIAAAIISESIAQLAPRAPQVDIAHINRIRTELTKELKASATPAK